MSTDTPETDAAVQAAGGDWSPVLRAVSQRLERERDEAQNASEGFSAFARKLERERDEAREIAARLAHFLERPAYSVDEAIARMKALNSYKKLKSK